MTGFATTTLERAHYALSVDLRSVNHRFLDIQFRMPDELRPFESELRELIVAQTQRGKIECRVNLTTVVGHAVATQLNSERLDEHKQLECQVRKQFPEASSLRVIDVLKWPNVLATESLAIDDVRSSCFTLLENVLNDFNLSRSREGEKLKTLLLERVTSIDDALATITPHLPLLIATYREKLGLRLREAAASLDEDRIRQEIALFAAKIDIDEELSRLRTHLGEVRRVLDQGGAVGKRLDFLMQELNREANTINSKSVDVSVSQVAMNIKVLIEQMREQVQNVE